MLTISQSLSVVSFFLSFYNLYNSSLRFRYFSCFSQIRESSCSVNTWLVIGCYPRPLRCQNWSRVRQEERTLRSEVLLADEINLFCCLGCLKRISQILCCRELQSGLLFFQEATKMPWQKRRQVSAWSTTNSMLMRGSQSLSFLKARLRQGSCLPLKMNIIKHSSIHLSYQVMIIKPSYLQIAPPYNQHALFFNSKFKGFGYYALALAVFFSICYPLLRYTRTGFLYWQQVRIIVVNNLLVDILYLLAVFLNANIYRAVKKFKHAFIINQGILVAVPYFLSGLMYSDRCFLFIIGWSFFWKLISYWLGGAQTNIQQFNRYLLRPTVVYKQKIGNKYTINSGYILAKSIMFFFCIYANLILIEDFILPALEQTDLLVILIKLIMPVFAFNLLSFVLIFQSIFSVLDELTGASDRVHYGLWWEAQNLEEAVFLWNILVIQFFDLHVLPSLKFLSEEARQALRFVSSVCSHNAILLSVMGLSISSVRNWTWLGSLLLVMLCVRKLRIGNFMVHIFFVMAVPTLIAIQMKFNILQ